MATEQHDLGRRDRGAVTQMTVVFVAAAMFGLWSLTSAGEAWNARREATAIAAAAARAGAQPSGLAEISNGQVALDPGLAAARAQSVISGTGASGSASASGTSVTASVTVPVHYTFGMFGFPGSMTASHTAQAFDED